MSLNMICNTSPPLSVLPKDPARGQALAEEAQALLGGVVLRLEGGGGRGPPRLRAPGGEFREASEVQRSSQNMVF